MAVTNNSTRIVKEGLANLQIPKTVFYNPIQEFNRDLSVLVLRTYLKYNVWHHRSEEKHIKSRGGMMILDALSASGLRSIRYAKELGESGNLVRKIVANDISEAAVELIKTNINLNSVQDKVSSSLSDAALLMYRSSANFEDRFHVIDLDPFGTAAQFIDAAVKGIGEAGLMMVTCTDTAVLCGNASESCFARYGSMSLKAEFCHEAGLRIILRSIESHAAVYGRYIKPLLSVSVDFYVRLFVQVFTQQSETKKSASKLSQIYLCKECKTPEFLPLGSYSIKESEKQAESKNDAVKFKFKPTEVNVGDRCKICDGHYTIGGPIWSHHIHNNEFLKLLKTELATPESARFGTYRRLQGLIHVCDEELDVPLFFSVENMASVLHIPMPRQQGIFSALLNAGYGVSATHTNKSGIKTDAPNSVVWAIFCQVAEQQNIRKNDSLALRIMTKPFEKKFSFAHNPKAEIESKKKSLLRFQVNPSKEWGPKSRPVNVNKGSEDEFSANKRLKLDDINQNQSAHE